MSGYDPILDPDYRRPTQFLVRAKRPDGSTFLMWVDNEHYDRVTALAIGEFKDKSIVEIGPRKYR